MKAISYVTSGFTLAAFIAAIIASIYRHWLLQRQQLISSVPESERAPLVEKTIEFFNIDTTGLLPEKKYELALKQIEARARRFRIIAIVIVIVAVLAAGVTALAMLHTPNYSLVGSEPAYSEAVQYSGRVVNLSNKQGIRGAKVSVDGQEATEVYTDTDGGFLLKPLRRSADSVHIRVEAQGYLSVDRNVSPSRSGIEDVLLTPESKSSERSSINHPGSLVVSDGRLEKNKKTKRAGLSSKANELGEAIKKLYSAPPNK